jgi:hypothetical protein
LKQFRYSNDSPFPAAPIRIWQVQPSAFFCHQSRTSAASGARGTSRFSTTWCSPGGRKNRSNSYLSVENEAE